MRKNMLNIHSSCGVKVAALFTLVFEVHVSWDVALGRYEASAHVGVSYNDSWLTLTLTLDG